MVWSSELTKTVTAYLDPTKITPRNLQCHLGKILTSKYIERFAGTPAAKFGCVEIMETLRVSHISKPIQPDKRQKRRYTSTPLSTKDRSGRYKLVIFVQNRLFFDRLQG